MWAQTCVFGEKLEVPTKEDLKNVCCEACYNATEPKCQCQCHGAFHGLGNLNKKAKIEMQKRVSEVSK